MGSTDVKMPVRHQFSSPKRHYFVESFAKITRGNFNLMRYLKNLHSNVICNIRSSSRDSGSHSRPGSAALVVDFSSKDNTDA